MFTEPHLQDKMGAGHCGSGGQHEEDSLKGRCHYSKQNKTEYTRLVAQENNRDVTMCCD